VLCPPLGRDALKTYFSYRILAEQLAKRGVAALRFDYDGTGDSAGELTDPDRLDAWLASTAAALLLARRCGAERVVLVGTTIGGTIAAHAAAADGHVDGLVLWDAAISGWSYLRKHSALSSLKFGVPARRADGSIETPGLVFAEATVADLKRLRLDALTGPVARCVLVLDRPDNEAPRAVTSRLGHETVEYGLCPGQSRLVDAEPPFQQIPHDDIELIARWIVPEAAVPSHEAQAPSSSPIAPPGSDTAVVARTDTGLEIRERFLSIPPAGLFAVATVAPVPASGRPVAVFLNSSIEHHIGPNRMWVDLARRWAAVGIDSVRVDLSGLGDSPVRHPRQKRLVCLAPEAFEDLEDVVRAASDGGSRPVILVGLCSSAYLAAESSLTLSPAGVVLINPVLRFAPPERTSGLSVDRRRVIAVPRRRETWENGNEPAEWRSPGPGATVKRLVRRYPRLDRLAQRVMERDTELRWRMSNLLHRMTRPRTWCRLLVEGNTDVLLIAGDGDDTVLRYDITDRVLSRLSSTGRFRYEHPAGLDHGMVQDMQRRAVSDLVTDHVRARFLGGTSDPGTIASESGMRRWTSCDETTTCQPAAPRPAQKFPSH
jgi:alpha-beta hydrolase superfamily lysophospholipase